MVRGVPGQRLGSVFRPQRIVCFRPIADIRTTAAKCPSQSLKVHMRHAKAAVRFVLYIGHSDRGHVALGLIAPRQRHAGQLRAEVTSVWPPRGATP